MVNNQIHATYMETYDINTIQNELSILAIHTPQSDTLKRFFHGLYEQYSKMKVLGCNFSIQCASKQELDPTLIGNGQGQIDPRDVLNPILFKACTGEGINTLLDQIYNASEEVAPSGSLLGSSIAQHIDANKALQAYYSLLADGSFRQAHPQRGMVVQGLKPMVHKVVTTQPFKWTPASPRPSIGQSAGAGNPDSTAPLSTGFGAPSGSHEGNLDPVNPSVFVSNGVTEMPWLDTAYSKLHTFADSQGQTAGTAKAYSLQSNIPRVYMGVLVLPPSAGTYTNLYFRITVVWHILFKDFRFSQDLLPVSAPSGIDTDSDSIEGHGLDDQNGYFNMYHTATKLQKDIGSFDTQGVESIDCIMEKGQ